VKKGKKKEKKREGNVRSMSGGCSPSPILSLCEQEGKKRKKKKKEEKERDDQS